MRRLLRGGANMLRPGVRIAHAVAGGRPRTEVPTSFDPDGPSAPPVLGGMPAGKGLGSPLRPRSAPG